MRPWLRVCIAGFLGGVAMFLWASIAHLATPLASTGIGQIGHETALLKEMRTALGDQTEAALHVVALKGGVDNRVASRTYPRVHELPFDARRKRMSTIHRNERGEIAFVKGAPKEVLQLCTHLLIDGEAQPLDDTTRAEIVAANDEYARQALRVLALARRDLSPRSGAYTPEKVEQGLTFLGLAAMMDPPRPDVAEAIKVCREAGIRPAAAPPRPPGH